MCTCLYAQRMSDQPSDWLPDSEERERKRCIMRPTKKDKKWRSIIDVFDLCYEYDAIKNCLERLYVFNIYDINQSIKKILEKRIALKFWMIII